MRKRILSIITAIAMATALVPVVPVAAIADEAAPAQASVEELLAAGDYVEGEAIALVRSDGGLDTAGDAETLMEVGADAVELAAENADKTKIAADDEASLRVQSARSDAYTVQHVVDPARTTEQILRDLYADPDVIMAEPNYTYDRAAAFASETQTTSAGSAVQQANTAHLAAGSDFLTASSYAGNLGDLTEQQWNLSASTANYTTPLSPTADYNVNVNGWREGRTNTSAQPNASGTVCIMDTGIDVNHPDLKGVVFEFSKDQQAKYGCGPHGMNASGVGEPSDVTDYNGHGTHVAGIVAAQWNGVGVSGVANGVKVFSVRTFSEGGNVTQVSTVKGFKFLVDAAQEINLKAVNCSWGNIRAEFILTVMANELGEKGVNIVFASGNRSLDLDENIDSGGQINSVYAITVDAAQPDGAMTDFSCWGQMTTDVFAPGAEILSTVPTSISMSGSYTDNTRFYPEATAQENLLYGIDRFGADASGVKFFDKNPALDSSAKEIGARTMQVGFDDKNAMEFNVRSLAKSDSFLGGYLKAENGSVFLAIPVESVADAKWIGLRYAVNDSNKLHGGIASITCAKKDGGAPVQVDNYCVSILGKGLTASTSGSVYWSQWMPKSLDVSGFVNASNEAHEKYLKDPASLDFKSQFDVLKYKDPGEVAGLYGWNSGGKTYVIAEVGLGRPEVGSIDDSTTFYIDNVAVGNGGAFTGAYEVMAGTSMATPCVTGCLTVIAKDEPASSTLSADQLELEARERAAKLLAAVDYDDELSKLCRTGGRVNLQGQSTFTKKAPLIAKALWKDDELTVDGCFFGGSGKLFVDDVEAAAATWSDNAITASVSGLDNGTHVAKVVNADGAVSRVLFSCSSDSAPGRPLYERNHSLPMSLQDYADKNTDRLYGAMVACNGKLFAVSATMDQNIAQDMWSYDIASDTWALVELPKDFVCEGLRPGCLAAMKGKVYMVGSARINEDDDTENALWQYDTSTSEWSRVGVKDLTSRECICALGDKLFLICNYDYQASEGGNSGGGKDASERAFFKLIDVDKGTVTPVKGDIPFLSDEGMDEPLFNTTLSRAVASDDKLYYYVHSSKQKIPGTLVRATYDANTQSMSVEDLSDAFKTAIGDNLDSYVDTQTSETLIDHFTIAGLSDGLAIIGSDKLGADTSIIEDSGTTAQTYERTSCYHHAANPLAAYEDGYLYVTANNATEPSVMYLRSTKCDDPEQKDPDSGLSPTRQGPEVQPGFGPAGQDSKDQSKADSVPNSGSEDQSKAIANSGSSSQGQSKASSAAAVPKTGDSLPTTTLGVLSALALAGLVAALVALRRRMS